MRIARRSVWAATSTVAVVVVAMGLASPAGAYRRPAFTERASVSSSGAEAETSVGPGNPTGDPWCFAFDGNLSQYHDTTPDGRYVAFASRASNLVVDDTNGVCDVFVRDRVTGRTERVSVKSDGTEARTPALAIGAATPRCMPGYGPESLEPSISESGRYVAFASAAWDLVPGDTNLACDVFVRDRKSGITERISLSSDGSQSAQELGSTTRPDSWHPSISGDGRYVAFSSYASDLVGDDANGDADIFLHDRKTRRTELVSLGIDGAQADRDSHWPFLSRSGRHVAFVSSATNLVPGTFNGISLHVYLYDLGTERMELISVSSDGTKATLGATLRGATGRVISDDGRFVIFWSLDRGLVPNDSNMQALGFSANDVFVRDRKTGRTERVSVRSDGEEADGNSPQQSMSISPDGRFVTFQSVATNLFPGDTNSTGSLEDAILGISDPDAYLHDRKTGALEWISVTPTGQESGPCASGDPTWAEQTQAGMVSAGGRYVTFGSCSTDLVKGDENGRWDLFVRDRGLPLEVGEVGVSGQAARLFLDGAPGFARTGSILIGDAERDVVSSKAGTADLSGARVVYRPIQRDIFVALELATMPRTPALAAATAGTVYGLSLDIDGRGYEIRSASSGLTTRGGTAAAFALFSCSEPSFVPGCVRVLDLQGGFGTTGSRITFSVPVDALELEDGSILSNLQAFTALGTLLGGSTTVLDEASIRQAPGKTSS